MAKYAVGDLAKLLTGAAQDGDDTGLFASTMNEKLPPVVVAPAAQGKKRARGEAGKAHAGEKETESKRAKGAAENKPAPTDAPEKDARTLFVGNVPIAAAKNLEKLKKALKREMGAAGKVESIRLRSVPVAGAAIPAGGDYKTMLRVSARKNKVEPTGQTCNAYVVFEESDAVRLALETLQGHEFHGFHLRLDVVRAKEAGLKSDRDKSLFDRRRSVFVGNLPTEAAEENLREFFASLPGIEVENVRIVRDRVSGLGKGFGYVLLKDHDMVVAALTADGTDFLKRAIRVSRCQKSASMAASANTAEAPKSGGFQGAHASFDPARAAKLRIRGKASKKAKAGAAAKGKPAKKKTPKKKGAKGAAK